MEFPDHLSHKGSVALSREILQGVNRIFQEALVCDTEEELGKLCLQVAEDLTQSQIGFIGLIDSQGVLFDIAASDSDHDTCRMEQRCLRDGLPIHGIYGKVLREGKGFFTNNPATHPDSIGLPQGHPRLNAFLGAPMLYEDKVIGMVGLANRPGGYRNNNLFTLKVLSVAIVQALKHKQTEASLRESEEQFRALFESTSVAMAMGDLTTGRLLRLNDTYTSMLGYTLEDLADKKFMEITHPEDRVADRAGFERMLRGEIPSYSSEKRLLHKDGHSIWCLVTANLVYDTAGQPLRSVAVIHDISGRKRMEEELRVAHQALEREQKFLEAVFDALPVGVCITDEQGGIIRTNHMDQEIFGTRPITKGVDDYQEYKAWWVDTGKRVQPEEWAAAQAVQTGKAIFGQLVEIQCFDGKRRVINNSAAPVIDDHGKVVGSAVVIQDVTTQWEYSRELREAKLAAEEASLAKSEFLANMSHEIRTPMTVIMGAIEQLQHIDNNPEHRNLLELADQSSQRLYNLINEILDFSKIEARRMDIDEDWFNFRGCLQENMAMMTAKAIKKGLRLELEVSPEVPESVVGDKYRLGQVLLNLVGNAIKFTDEGEVKVTVHRHEDILKFTVSDTGAGIPANMLETIFETFSQVDSSSTRRYGGTGLGLAISRGLVKLLGGRISVRSQLGQGSIFTFTLPVRTKVPEPSLSETDSNSLITDAPEAHILLVEDNPMVREVVLMTLSQRPWQITTAASGRDAAQKWQSTDFDVILMDLQMVDMDGLKATREIRRLEAFKVKRVGIIGLTTQANHTVQEECITAGMNEVLVKPIEAASLYTAIERCLAD
jgi:PAS domain S-box-containing protein